MRPRRNCLVEGPSSTPHFILVVLPFTLVASSFAVGGNRTAAFAHCSSALVVHLDSNAEISRSFRLPVDPKTPKPRLFDGICKESSIYLKI